MPRTISALALLFIALPACLHAAPAASKPPEPWTTVANAGKEVMRTGPSRIAPEVGKVPARAKATPLAVRGSFYKVRFEDGRVGWVPDKTLAETAPLLVTKAAELHKPPRRGARRPGKVLRKLEPGETVQRLGLSKDGGWYTVKTQDGKKGVMSRHRARPIVESALPEYNRNDKRFFREDKLISAVVGKTPDQVERFLGTPGAVVLGKDGAQTWHYRNRIVVRDGVRHRNIALELVGGEVAKVRLEDDGSSSWAEGLPLARVVRGLTLLDALTYLLRQHDLEVPSTWHWFFRLVVRLAIIGFAVVILSLATIVAFFFTGFIDGLRFLSNAFVKLISYAFVAALTYAYFLVVALHLLQDAEWFAAVVMGLATILAWIMIGHKVNYNRCPNCRAMWHAQDEGTELVGKTHVTTHKSRDDYSHTTEDSTTRTRHYVRKRWKERTTRMNYDDHRSCAECGYRWAVARQETVDGHV